MTGGNRQPTAVASTSVENWAVADRIDRFRDSALDFVFTAQGARDWKAEVGVIIRPGDFPDDATTSDQWPVEANLDPAAAGVDVGGPRE